MACCADVGVNWLRGLTGPAKYLRDGKRFFIQLFFVSEAILGFRAALLFLVIQNKIDIHDF